MSVDKGKRGRPKGSGLDDRNHLRAVNRLLAADPTLKPTTAIKTIGITDPSTIRRLRDKLRADAGTAKTARQKTHNSVVAPDRSTSSKSVGHVEERGHMQTRPAPGPSLAGSNLSLSPEFEAADLLAAWCGVSLQAFASTIEAQMAALDSLLRLPNVASALKTQALLSQSVLALSSSKRRFSTTLH